MGNAAADTAAEEGVPAAEDGQAPTGALPAWFDEAALTEEGLTLPERLQRIEAGLIQDALDRNNGNISRTAAELGIKRQGLQYKLKGRDSK